jgi:hypothetical protein
MRSLRLIAIVVILPVAALAQQSTQRPVAAVKQATAGHPDLSGVWSFTIDLPKTALKTEVNGKTIITSVDRGTAVPRNTAWKGTLPFTAKPSYRPEFQEKVNYLAENESKTDPVFYCDRPGIPRIGPPRKIIQLPDEIVFLYEDISGDPYRVIPISTPEKPRAHRKNANPSYYGDSVAHWEGNMLVVDARNFVEDTWIGEDGAFHSDALRVIERFWKDGEYLIYQPTVEDPKVLAQPWTLPPRVVKPSAEPLEESPKCVESDGPLLLNNDHHLQR